MAKQSSTKLNLCLPESTKIKLRALSKRTGKRSMAEVARRAFEIYNQLYDAKCRGARVVVVERDGDEYAVLL